MVDDNKAHIWITNGLLTQFNSTWKMLKKAMENIPDEYWYGTDKDWNYSRTVYHIIETQEFYIRTTPEGMIWGKFLGDITNKDATAEEKYPSKEKLQQYLLEIEEKMTDHLKNIKFEELFDKDDFKWFSSVFEKLLYLLRHNAHHLGELGRMLREWECTRMKWQ